MPQDSTSTKPIQIFRAGRHIAMSGAALSFSDSDLVATAAAYDPALHEAPLVVGHPRHDAPAYGWVRSLAAVGGSLEATPDQVDAAFAEIVDAGRYKKVSASFYTPNHPSNPKPGVYYLRHVGFLGAHPPAVKGLQPVEFADDEDGIVTVEFGEREKWGWRAVADLLRRLREKWIEKEGVEDADATIPNHLISDIERAGEEETAEEPSPNFSEGDPPITQPSEEKTMPGENDDRTAEFAERENRIAQQEAELQQRQERLEREEAERRQREITDFAERLESEGRILPRQRVGVEAVLGALDADQALEFGEGDGAYKGTAGEWLRTFLAELPEQVDFAERAGTGRGEPGQAQTADFAAPDGFEVDAESLKLHQQAEAYAREYKVSYDEAVDAVSRR